EVKDSVQLVLNACKRPNPFTNNRPGPKWFELFLKRHSEITKRNTEIISKARAAVTEEKIREWFCEVQKFITEQNCTDIFDDPARIINCDETGMQTCPVSGKLLCPKKMPDFYEICGDSEKECITVLCTFSADGYKFPPMIMFPYKRIPKLIASTLPENYVIGRSDSGWMVSPAFFEYIANSLYHNLVQRQVKFPVLLFLDRHKSHLSLELSEYCVKKEIHMFCLPSNATHILQPCDVSIFKPLKSFWKSVVRENKKDNDEERFNRHAKIITKYNFGTLFKKAFDNITIESIINGFRVCGLYPFNPDAVNYNKCISNRFKELCSNNSEHDSLNSNEQPVASSSWVPTKSDFITTKKTLLYLLEANMGKNNLEKEPNYLEQLLNICDERIGMIECNTEPVEQLIENTLSNSDISLSNLNILDIPIEIDGILYNTSDIDPLNITPETQVTYSTDKNVTN
ncbi:Uncharacterized protein FWK35_00038508, partial [Aphis craccivora]